MYFIGDVHGKWNEYFKIIEGLGQPSIQVGDFGIGFKKAPKQWNLNHLFIRGNHDKPSDCLKHPNYLGNCGYSPKTEMFWISGAFSIDHQWRKQYEMIHGTKIWWPDEELSEDLYDGIANVYLRSKPEIVVAHDCPDFVVPKLTGNAPDKLGYRNRTCNILLPKLIKLHKPKLWIFGHYHCSVDVTIDGVRYKCLNELEVFNV